VRVAVEALGVTSAPEAVLRRLAARARTRGLAPPAALIGAWFDGAAVIAPSVRISAVRPAEAFQVLDRPPEVSDAPPGAVGGGWLGYLGFGLADRGRRRRRLPLAAWGWADHVLRLDRDGRWWFEALIGHVESRRGFAKYPYRLADELAALLRAGGDPPPGRWEGRGLQRPDREQHLRAIEHCQRAIADGEVYQANVCTRFGLRLSGDPIEVFAAAMTKYSPTQAAFVSGGWGALVSASPELFLARRSRLVWSSPIKGTDAASPARLADSAKDRAENVMIVDLVRNDLGQVCETGSVTVPELLAVHPAPGVWHLVSTVSGRLRPGVTDAQLLAATFPPGSVTGTPKVRALQLLTDLEPAPREAYCGAIGMVSPAAGLQLNVAIRTVEVLPGGEAWLGVGGGITIDSEPSAEWAECLAKAAPLLDLLGVVSR
jgi:para-aminobenzoate synthetase component 1